MEFNVEQKIEAKNSKGISEAQLQEWVETFEYFDKNKNGSLDKLEFKSCLRSCGNYYYYFFFIIFFENVIK